MTTFYCLKGLRAFGKLLHAHSLFPSFILTDRTENTMSHRYSIIACASVCGYRPLSSKRQFLLTPLFWPFFCQVTVQVRDLYPNSYAHSFIFFVACVGKRHEPETLYDRILFLSPVSVRFYPLYNNRRSAQDCIGRRHFLGAM
jgi:hypothetical protein